ncbi:MAG TPA: alkaline phosphatase family protein [Thermoanaerobaculia bacterium]|jgi:predicted AlkP superfamily pyrophosphatase or phosphodiesterase|nr:alkaline phosphatase family protein [Thermoanaerobaculia bacterium]
MRARLRRWIVPVLVLSACQTAPSQAPQAPPPAEPPRRVVLLSLDGASTDELHRLYREGAFSAGGFARFFQEGQVADRLVPVNPSLTAPNHISLAAGYPAGQTGIVANTLHRPGTPFLETVSGFAAAIDTETLWEAARRQGKRVGVVTWPGADDNGERRRADWGMTYVNAPDRRADLVTLERRSWQPAGEFARLQGIESRSPVRGAKVNVGSGGPGTQMFNLLAVDRTDDGTVNYDGVIVLQSRGEGRPPSLPAPLTVGAWEDVPCQVVPTADSKARETPCPIKLLQLAPDLASARLYFGGLYPIQAYPPDFAAALAAQGLLWSGPPDDQRLADSWAGKPGIDLETWTQQDERFAHFFGDSLLAAVQRPDWDLLMGYMPVIDEAGHQLTLTDPRQPGFSPQRRDELAAARRRVWQAVDRELARILAAVDLRTTVVAVVSDHGMAPVHTLIDPNVLLREQGLLAANENGEIVQQGTAAYAVGSGGVSHVYIAPGRGDLVRRLRRLFADWTIGSEKPVERIFTRKAAAEVGLDHPNSGDLILFVREGYSARGGLLQEGRAAVPADVLGMHGYLNVHPEVHAIYLAVGAGIPQGNAGTVQNPEVAGRVAAWLGIEKPRPTP